MMKKTMVIFMTAAFLLLPTVCSGGEMAVGEEGQEAVFPEASETDSEEYEITLYADFSCGSETAEEDGLIMTESFWFADPLEDFEVADLLSEWTGLDFIFNDIQRDGEVMYLDWAAESTLIAGLDDREQKEEFFLYDNYSLSWFMMDSLRLTMMENSGVTDVYYTMDGGQELVFEDLYPVAVFPSDIPYMGSAFYYAHTDVRGEGDVTEDEWSESDMTMEERPAHGVLVRTGSFTGQTPLETNNDYYGGYYYADMTEDMLTTIINCGFVNDYSADEFMEGYIGRCIELISETEVREIDLSETTRGSYPAYYLTWLTGENEDTCHWDALMICTDNYTYMYAFKTAADYAEEKADVLYEVLDGVTLEFPEEQW